MRPCPSISPSGRHCWLVQGAAKLPPSAAFRHPLRPTHPSTHTLWQVGICGDPKLYASAAAKKIDDDKVGPASNKRGTVSFATSGPNARSTQVFFNLVDNTFLDESGFTPFAKVTGNGMEAVVDKLYAGYGEGAPKGRGPEQARIKEEGDAYLANFPKLSTIVSAKIAA